MPVPGQNKNHKPLVSIVLTTCNLAAYLDKCLASIQTQSFRDYELLIMDDQSEDNTEEVVEKWRKLFSIGGNYRHIRNEPRLGFQRSLNRGLREARGEYIAHLDDDDTWIDADKIRKQVDFLNANPDCVLVGTGLVSVDENGKEILRSLLPLSDKEIREKLLYANSFIHSSVLFRKAAAIKVGGYIEPKGKYCSEDHDLWLKLGTVGTMANLPVYGVAYTVRKRGLGHTLRNRFIPAAQHFKVIWKFRHDYPYYRRAVLIHLSLMTSSAVNIIADVPPFRYLRNFLRNRFPFLWKLISLPYRIPAQVIPWLILRLSQAMGRQSKP